MSGRPVLLAGEGDARRDGVSAQRVLGAYGAAVLRDLRCRGGGTDVGEGLPHRREQFVVRVCVRAVFGVAIRGRPVGWQLQAGSVIRSVIPRRAPRQWPDTGEGRGAPGGKRCKGDACYIYQVRWQASRMARASYG